jgi:hypothetical protein
LGLVEGRDFRVAPERRCHLRYVHWSERARADTTYTVELFDAELLPPSTAAVEADANNRWLTEGDIRAGRSRDGRAVSATVLRILYLCAPGQRRAGTLCAAGLLCGDRGPARTWPPRRAQDGENRPLARGLAAPRQGPCRRAGGRRGWGGGPTRGQCRTGVRPAPRGVFRPPGSRFPHLEIRASVLGHLQRGGTPTAGDRTLAAHFAEGVWEAVTEAGRPSGVVALLGGRVVLQAFDAPAPPERAGMAERIYLLHKALSRW